MNKIQILESEIRKALPRLMEVREGCLVSHKETGELYEIYAEYSGFYKLFTKNNGLVNELAIRVKRINDTFEVVGHDILLTDVLEWMGNLLDFVVSQKGSIFREFGNHFVSRIDFSKPHLKDQSEELKEFLYNLIKK